MEILSEILLLKFFGMKFMDSKDFFKLLFRFGFNFTFLFLLVRGVYYPVAKKKEYFITFFLISTTVFLLCFLLDNVKLELGFALGLFAIFGIIRYRTDAIPIKEMTYLFIVIGLSVINALANKKISYAELLFTNVVIVSITFFLERFWLSNREAKKKIVYEKVELITPDKKAEMHKDLELRTGIKINRFEIGDINFFRNSVDVKIFYNHKK